MIYELMEAIKVRVQLVWRLQTLFYVLVGTSLVLITTPGVVFLPGGSGAVASVALWPLVGLLAYLLHVFEEWQRLSSGDRTSKGSGDGPRAAGSAATADLG